MWDIFVTSFIDNRGYNDFFEGLLNTVIIAVFGLLIGFVLGSIFAIVKQVPVYKNPVLLFFQKIIDLYVTIFRGTPMVVQLLIIHFVLFPAMGINFKTIVLSDTLAVNGTVIEAIISFGLNSAAYMAEIMRGGIESVDKGQLEAGRALGLSYPSTMVNIVIPQAFKNVLPTLGNEFIALIKETSVCSFIAVTDLTKAFQNIAASTYEYIVPYIVLAICYLVLVILITILIKAIERKLNHAQMDKKNGKSKNTTKNWEAN